MGGSRNYQKEGVIYAKGTILSTSPPPPEWGWRDVKSAYECEFSMAGGFRSDTSLPWLSLALISEFKFPFIVFIGLVLCLLRFLAKGYFFSEVGDIHGIYKASMSVLLLKVCRALCLHLNNIKFPSSQQTLHEIKQKFYNIAGFPNVIGAIDGTLIPIRAVGGDEEQIYVSRKGFHALNIQGVVDADVR